MESSAKSAKQPNHLANEKSPYLQQHAFNPVDWYPWGEEAFRRATALDKPILLSIGYSTCHWCHVMERESFEDEAVAKLLNDTFVCIKVDREERPDIDSIYMHFCQATTGSGGWPLNVILTPDRKPLFAMTYMPRTTRRGLMGITEMASSVGELWKNQRSELAERSESIMEDLKNMTRTQKRESIPEDMADRAVRDFAGSYDSENGGFGGSPKFPSPHNLVFLLQDYSRTGNARSLEMAEKTLLRMRLGGIYDHVGNGFHRYSTDPFWIVPHFEKMLYDQAMLIWAYTEAFQVTGKELYKSVVSDIFSFLEEDMKGDDPVYFSAIDADSEGMEGKYYIWKKDEIERAAGDGSDAFCSLYNVSGDGNFNVSEGNIPPGENILYLSEEAVQGDSKLPWEVPVVRSTLESLKNERKKRTMPHVDRKILTDINSLLSYSLLKAAAVFGERKYLDSALGILDFIEKKMAGNGGMIMHSYMDGQTGNEGFLDDYSFLTAALIEAFQATGMENYIQMAGELQKHLQLHFEDENGGYYLAADYESSNIYRMRPDMDGAIPSGNSFQLLNLVNLFQILDDPVYMERAESIPLTLADSLQAAPRYHSLLLIGIEHMKSHFAVRKLVEKGHEFDEYCNLRKEYIPDLLFIPIREYEKYELEQFSEIGASGALKGGKYQLCSGSECYLPTEGFGEVRDMIRKKAS